MGNAAALAAGAPAAGCCHGPFQGRTWLVTSAPLPPSRVNVIGGLRSFETSMDGAAQLTDAGSLSEISISVVSLPEDSRPGHSRVAREVVGSDSECTVSDRVRSERFGGGSAHRRPVMTLPLGSAAAGGHKALGKAVIRANSDTTVTGHRIPPAAAGRPTRRFKPAPPPRVSSLKRLCETKKDTTLTDQLPFPKDRSETPVSVCSEEQARMSTIASIDRILSSMHSLQAALDETEDSAAPASLPPTIVEEPLPPSPPPPPPPSQPRRDGGLTTQMSLEEMFSEIETIYDNLKSQGTRRPQDEGIYDNLLTTFQPASLRPPPAEVCYDVPRARSPVAVYDTPRVATQQASHTAGPCEYDKPSAPAPAAAMRVNRQPRQLTEARRRAVHLLMYDHIRLPDVPTHDPASGPASRAGTARRKPAGGSASTANGPRPQNPPAFTVRCEETVTTATVPNQNMANTVPTQEGMFVVNGSDQVTPAASEARQHPTAATNGRNHTVAPDKDSSCQSAVESEEQTPQVATTNGANACTSSSVYAAVVEKKEQSYPIPEKIPDSTQLHTEDAEEKAAEGQNSEQQTWQQSTSNADRDVQPNVSSFYPVQAQKMPKLNSGRGCCVQDKTTYDSEKEMTSDNCSLSVEVTTEKHKEEELATSPCDVPTQTPDVPGTVSVSARVKELQTKLVLVQPSSSMGTTQTTTMHHNSKATQPKRGSRPGKKKK